MSATTTVDDELDERVDRAMTEPLHIEQLAPGMYEVQTVAGDVYKVDPSLGACECPDHEYNIGDVDGVRCKHVLAVVFRLGPAALSS